jgi:NAD(P)H-flavin reductase/ferredoxin
MTHRITISDTEVAFDCPPNQTVLEAAEAAGWSIPYSCRKGVCTTCTGALHVGELVVRGKGIVQGPDRHVLLCQARPLSPVLIAPKRIERRLPPARKTIDATVYRIRRPDPLVTIVDLRFPIGLRAPFRAGQYLSVHLPDGDSRSYSLANAPQHNDSAQLHIRTMPGGRFSGEIVPGLRRGDTVPVTLPFGEFVLDHDRDDPVLLLATGTGFGPVQSIVADQIARRCTRPVHLYWGGRTAADLYLMDLAAKWAARRPWFRFTPVLSRPAAGWPGVTGRVQDAALADYPDLSTHQVYACGNQAMTEDALDLLGREAGLTEDRFHCDAFVPSADLTSTGAPNDEYV